MALSAGSRLWGAPALWGLTELRRWHDRYGSVMEAAIRSAGLDFGVLPDTNGLRLRGGNQYWTKYWIQVFYELLKGMTEEEQAEAMERLEKEGVEIDERSRPKR